MVAWACRERGKGGGSWGYELGGYGGEGWRCTWRISGLVLRGVVL